MRGASKENEVSVSTRVSSTAVQGSNVIVVSLCLGASAVKSWMSEDKRGKRECSAHGI